VKIAVVGAGISGLGAAHVLARQHEVEVFEAGAYAGGHTATVDVQVGARTLGIDTGFIVHNLVNYPNLLALFAELGVATQESEMSFAVTCAGCGLEFSSRWPVSSPSFTREVIRFQRSAEGAVADDRHAASTLGRFAAVEGYSERLRSHFLVPLCAAIWSTAPGGALDFPARYAIAFLSNHGVLGFRHFRWRTVTGGSREYVRALLGRFGGAVHLDAPVRAVERDADGITLRTPDGEPRRFDRVVIATHPDQALALLTAPTDDERRLLGAFAYTANETVLHTDERFLPARPRARASWNYHLASCDTSAQLPTMTYSMNRLQGLTEPKHYCVTLNRGAEIDPGEVLGRFLYEHPQYTFASLAAQAALPTLNGPNRTAFAGAYHGHGFHEDGLTAGLRAAAAIVR
jgi:predicted NAD/FAD-binding protein